MGSAGLQRFRLALNGSDSAAGSFDPFLGTTGFMPGWTALGDRGYAGYAWYRLKVNVQYDPGLSEGGLEIKMPDDVDDAYQVFVNGAAGRRVRAVYAEWRQDLSHPSTDLCAAQGNQERPDHVCHPSLDGSRDVADESRMRAACTVHRSSDRLVRLSACFAWIGMPSIVPRLSRFLELAVLLLAIIVAAVLFWLDRKEKAYLWLGLACAGVALQTIVTLIGNYTAVIPASFFFVLSDAVLKPGVIALWIIFWAYWFRMGRMPRHAQNGVGFHDRSGSDDRHDARTSLRTPHPDSCHRLPVTPRRLHEAAAGLDCCSGLRGKACARITPGHGWRCPP